MKNDDGHPPQYDQPKVGPAIRFHRKRKGWTLKELGEHTECSVAFLSDIERGRTNPSIHTLFAIANALETTIADITDKASSGLSSDEIDLVEAYRARDLRQALRIIINTKE